MKPLIEAKLDSDDEETGQEGDQSHRQIQSGKVKTTASGALLRKPKSNGKLIPAVEFLSDIANALHAEVMELSIDYLLPHRFCWELLRKINNACRPYLLEMYGGDYLEKENQLPFVAEYIFMAATTTS